MPESIAISEVLSELNVESRTILAFRVDEKIVEQVQWLPPGWKVAPSNAGPFKDANLLVIFSDRLLVQDKEGNPMPGPEIENPLWVIVLVCKTSTP